MAIALLIGRIIVGVYFIMSAFNHFTRINQMAAYARMKGVPGAVAAVGFTGILLLLGGLSLLLGAYPVVGAALLIVFLIGVTAGMHNFWTISDEQARAAEMLHFMKNVAMIGLLLMSIGIPRPWPLSIGLLGR